MGITQVDSREAERFEEGIEPEFLDAEEESPKALGMRPNAGHLSGASHGVMAVHHYKNVWIY